MTGIDHYLPQIIAHFIELSHELVVPEPPKTKTKKRKVMGDLKNLIMHYLKVLKQKI